MTDLGGVGQASLAALGSMVAVFRGSAGSDSPAGSECRWHPWECLGSWVWRRYPLISPDTQLTFSTGWEDVWA